MELIIEDVFEKIINKSLFKKETWISKILKKIKCRSSCICSIEPEEIIEKKNLQKEHVMEFIKLLKEQVKESKSNNTNSKNIIILESEI